MVPAQEKKKKAKNLQIKSKFKIEERLQWILGANGSIGPQTGKKPRYTNFSNKNKNNDIT